MASVTYASVSKVYDNGVRALREFSLEIQDGEFMVFVGPSGCGKTTALRSVAGLEEVSSGEIRIGAKIVNDVDPRHRDVAMVFQNYALYPYMSVYDNIAFGLKVRRFPKRDIDGRVQRIARILGLEEMLQRKPGQLSGGQRQRVAMGRAIVRDPAVFLMDEPLSNLDARLRVQMRAEVSRIQHDLGATTIYVTHDQVEAMTMGDRVTVLRLGVLQQTGSPKDLYDRPTNLFVASFIGSPPMNLFQATLERDNGSLRARIGEQTLPVTAATAAARPALERFVGRVVALGIRPEDVQDVADSGADAATTIRGHVTATESLGSEILVHAEIPAEPVVTDEVREVAGDVDQAALEDLESGLRRKRASLIGRLAPDHPVRHGDNVNIQIDTSKLHFFDLETGDAVYGD